MLRRRLVYALALLGALAFQIFNDAYLAQLALTIMIFLPVLSLLLSLPVMLGCHVQIQAAQAVRGGAAAWQIRVQLPGGLPLARLTMRLSFQNMLTGANITRRAAVTGLCKNNLLTIPVDTAHCGRLECTVSRLRVCDYLGLFAIWRAAPMASTLILPQSVAPETLPEQPAQQAPGEAVSVRKTRTGEDYELRPYRPGDPMRMVHWKQSAKQDELVVREMLSGGASTVCLSFDFFGTPDALDQAFDRLHALGLWLLSQGKSFYISWLAPDGTACAHAVATQAQLSRCLASAMSLRAPDSRPAGALPARPQGVTGAVLSHHICTGEEAAPCQNPPA